MSGRLNDEFINSARFGRWAEVYAQLDRGKAGVDDREWVRAAEVSSESGVAHSAAHALTHCKTTDRSASPWRRRALAACGGHTSRRRRKVCPRQSVCGKVCCVLRPSPPNPPTTRRRVCRPLSYMLRAPALQNGTTALHMAAFYGPVDAIDELARRGAALDGVGADVSLQPPANPSSRDGTLPASATRCPHPLSPP